MNPEYLSTVVLVADLPEFGLLSGDVGAVVEKFGNEGLEVEFVDGAGRTRALATLDVSQVRQLGASELLSVRSLDAA